MYQPVLKSLRTRYGNNRWMVYSVKLGRRVHLTSDLEYGYWFLIETDPRVVDYCEQPLRVSVKLGQRTHTTVFDMWEKWEDGHERFVEVKYAHELDPDSPRKSARSIRQTQLQKQWCNDNGFNYAIVTDQDIYSTPLRLQNCKRIVSLVREPCPNSHTLTAATDVLASGPSTIAEIMQQVPGLTALDGLIVAAHMLFSGIATADLEYESFGPKTNLSLNT